jgi:hypothetical protein
LKKYLPLIMVAIGFLLIIGALISAWQSTQPQAAAGAPAGAAVPAGHPTLTSGTAVPDAGGVPKTIAGLALSDLQKGDVGVAAIKQLYGVDLPLVSGLMATYGQSGATLWVAETESPDKATELMTAMKARIDKGGSPFTPVGVFNFRSRDVFLLNGSDGKQDFYMKSGKLVFWVAISAELSEQAMKEMLDFFP